MKIPFSAILKDPITQARVRISKAVVKEYADAMTQGAAFPPVILFVEEATGTYWLGDGWYRTLAAESLALSEIEAEVRPGGKRAAFLHALGANGEHGQRRTRADKLNAIHLAFSDELLRQRSDREIARIVGVDHKTVGKVRMSLNGDSAQTTLDSIRMGHDGRIRRCVGRVGISPVDRTSNPRTGIKDAGLAPSDFNPVKESHSLEAMMDAKFSRWPKDKQHAFCVALYNFAKQKDPEILERKQDFFDELLERSRANE